MLIGVYINFRFLCFEVKALNSLYMHMHAMRVIIEGGMCQTSKHICHTTKIIPKCPMLGYKSL